MYKQKDYLFWGQNRLNSYTQLSLELEIYKLDLITNKITMAWLGDLNSLKDKIEFDSDILTFLLGLSSYIISEDKLMACYYTSLLPFQLHINKMLLFTTYRWIFSRLQNYQVDLPHLQEICISHMFSQFSILLLKGFNSWELLC